MKSMKIAAVLLASCAIASALSISVSTDGIFGDKSSDGFTFMEFHSPRNVPVGWTIVDTPGRDQLLNFKMYLAEEGLDELDRIFNEVSDPNHENYAKYLTIDEIAEFVHPKEENVQTAVNWLESHGITDYHLSKCRNILSFKASADVAEQSLFQSKFFVFEHLETGMQLTRTLGPYSLPNEIAEITNVVEGTLRFPKINANYASHDEPSVLIDSRGMSTVVTPSVIISQYGITDKGSNSQNSQAVAEWIQQYYSEDDLSKFFSIMGLPDTTDIVTLSGADAADSPAGTESMLDIEYIMGVAQDVPTWFFYSNDDSASIFLDYVEQQLDDPNSPWVHSISYGENESGLSSSLLSQANTEFQKFGTTGRSLIVASGDSGVGCTVFGNDLVPDYPASSPYVTAVGATTLSGNSEIAVTDFPSGGGFSNYYDQPSYQSAAVSEYFAEENANSLPSSGSYNADGRGYPDVSALGQDYEIVVNGKTTYVDGTSASTPTFAAIIALINDNLLDQNKATLGFLNPFLYDNADAFTDVTTGNNDDKSCDGFQTAAGWDPVTGLGTPKYSSLKSAALSAQ